MKTTFHRTIALLAFSAVFASAVFAEDTPKTFTFQSRRTPGATDKVVTFLEVVGDFKERDQKAKEQRIKMHGADQLTYHEMSLEAKPGRMRSIRYYEKADSAVNSPTTPTSRSWAIRTVGWAWLSIRPRRRSSP
jgi:hypothetical protein